MDSRMMLAACVLILTAGASAQTTRPVELPYTAVVAGQDVYVRSGPGSAYYPCAKLSYPTRVRVVGLRGGWAEVLPPRVCFSLIAKSYVRAEGVSGTVTGTNVRVRAGSSVEPQRMDEIQTHLNVGDKVTILGEQADYYKIVPPAGVRLWVATEFIRTGEGLLTTLPTQSGAEIGEGGAVPPPPTGGPAKERAEFEAADQALKKEYEKPREQRNLPALLERYKALSLSPGSPYAAYVQMRVEFLQDEVELAKDIQEAERILREAETTRGEMAAERQKIRTEMPTVMPRKVYAAEGVLHPSTVFTGGATGPKRYVVGNAERTLVYAYLESTSDLVDLSKYVGQYVGVVGAPRYDEKSGMYVIEVEQLTPLRQPGRSSGESPPAQPEPTTAPAVGAETPPPGKPLAQTGERAAGGAKPLPPTGLPVFRPTTRPAAVSVNAEEYQ